MVVRRLLAIVAAGAMVVVALAVRDRLHGDDGGGSDTPAASTLLTCIEELAPVCRAWAGRHDEVAVQVEPALATVDRLTSAEGPGRPDAPDGWLTLSPLPDLVDGARARAGRAEALDAPTAPLARSPLVMVAWNDRLAVLAEACGPGAVGWTCLGDRAGVAWSDIGGGATWGAVKPGHASPDSSAVGLAAFGQAAAARAGVADPSAAEQADPAVRAWLRQLERSVPSFGATLGTPLAQALVSGPAAYDVVATTEAEARTALARSARSAELTIAYPAPMATADVVFAPRREAPGADRLARLMADDPPTAELADAGWRVDGAAADRSGVALDPSDGLPSAGSLEALRALWRELVR